jgi:hypothetical protein
MRMEQAVQCDQKRRIRLDRLHREDGLHVASERQGSG